MIFHVQIYTMYIGYPISKAMGMYGGQSHSKAALTSQRDVNQYLGIRCYLSTTKPKKFYPELQAWNRSRLIIHEPSIKV